MFNRLRGIDKWPSTTATVASIEDVGTGGRSGLSRNVYFSYHAGELQSGKLFVDDNSSLYDLGKGEEFPIQFNPKRPSEYFSAEADSLSQTFRSGLLLGSFALVIIIVAILVLGR